jgi:hypothetical protein
MGVLFLNEGSFGVFIEAHEYTFSSFSLHCSRIFSLSSLILAWSWKSSEIFELTLFFCKVYMQARERCSFRSQRKR